MGVFLFGKDAKLYTSTAPLDGTLTAHTATWVEYQNVTDITGNYSGQQVDTTTRETAATGWTSSEIVAKNGEVTATFPQKDAADATLALFIAAWDLGTTMALLVLNGDIATAGREGLAANFSVDLTQNQPLLDRQTWDATLRVASFPEWFVAPQTP